jgi:hypothetical protein
MAAFWLPKNRLIESPRVDLAITELFCAPRRGRFLERGAAAGPDIASAKRRVLPEIKNGRAGVWPFPPQPQAIAKGLPLRGQAAGRPGRGAFTSKTIKRCAKICCVLP